MTAEWLHLPPPYPPGVGPLCGAELEAWYEDLQDILGSDTGGAKLARAPTCTEKEPEFLDVLESCSLTWLSDGSQTWSEGVQRATEIQRRGEGERGRSGDSSTGGGSDLLPPEFFALLSDGGLVDQSGEGYYYHHHQSTHVHPGSPSASEEELPCVPDSPSCSSSASQSPSQNCSSPSSPVSSPSVTSSSYTSAKKSRKEREQENERKVQELTEQNERLKAEIERLGEEVQRTRRALIERLVNTRK
uniref:DNA damage-inducible transcript 3 protein n=1 Tax=Periophthalmus magnuspinnatus TaxID=409849 RepID=A0A3B4APF5_9GOBI